MQKYVRSLRSKLIDFVWYFPDGFPKRLLFSGHPLNFINRVSLFKLINNDRISSKMYNVQCNFTGLRSNQSIQLDRSFNVMHVCFAIFLHFTI